MSNISIYEHVVLYFWLELLSILDEVDLIVVGLLWLGVAVGVLDVWGSGSRRVWLSGVVSACSGIQAAL